jgi:hypothetical protein
LVCCDREIGGMAERQERAVGVARGPTHRFARR